MVTIKVKIGMDFLLLLLDSYDKVNVMQCYIGLSKEDYKDIVQLDPI